MAKGTTIGFLNFGIDGDNKELLKAIKQAEKEVISLDKFMSNMKIGLNTKSMTADVQKAVLSTDKLAISNNKVAKSAAEMALSETKAANQVLKDTQNLMYQEERLVGLRKRNSLIGVQGQKDLATAYGLTNKTMFSQKNLLQQLSSAAGIYFSVYQVAGFVKELATVSGEFEKQRVSLAAIIGDADAANKIFNQIKDLAVISPFNFKELTDYAKQLSAFSIPTNEIYDTTKRLADLSAGLGVDMSRIILAYGQVRSAAVLRGQELRQFTEAGIPLVDELAKKFGELEGRVVSAGEVFDKISNREASFGMVKEIINDLTSEGGKFFEMQELQSATLAGKISNLRDNYDMMLDSLGKANKGLLHGAMDGLVDVMDHWERYFAILQSIIIGYGVYKAAVIASSIATNGLSASIKGCAAAQALFNSISKLNPYALLAAGIGAVISGLISYVSAQKQAEEELYKTIGIINNQTESVNNLINKLKELTSKAKDDTQAQIERNNIIEELSKTEPLLASYIKEHATNLKELTKAQKEYNDLQDAQKLAEYMADESNGWFKDGVKEDLEDLQEAQNKLNVATAGLDTTYTKLIESINKIKKDGGLKTPIGLREFNKNTLAEIDAIIASEKTRAEKLQEVYTLLDPSRRWRKGIGKNAPTLESNFGESIFGTPSSGKYAEYTKALGEFGLAAKEANGELDSLSSRLTGFLNNTGNGVESLNKIKTQFETLSGISYKSFISKDSDEQAKYLTEDVSKLYDEIQRGESKLKGLVENLGWLGKYGKERILTRWDIELNGNKDLSVPLTGWRKEIQDLVGTNIVITAESNLNDVSNDMEKQYKELKARIDEQKPILIKYGFDLKTGQFPYPARTETMTQMGNNFVADTKAADALTNGLKAAGKATNDLIKPKGGQPKDHFAEQLRKRIDLLKEARSEYDKLVKAGVPEEEAATKISKLDSFGGVDPRQYNSDIDKIISDLQKKGEKIPKEQAEILRSLILSRDTEGLAKYAEQLSKDSKEAIEKIDKELSKYKEQYSLYEYIFGKTGDRNQAMKIAFGDIQGQVKTYRDYLVSAIEKATDSDKKKKLQEQLIDFDFGNKADFAKRMTDLVAEFQSVDEKISVIKAKGEATRLEIEKNVDKASQDIVEKRLKANQDSINKQVSELTNGVLQATESYQRLFEDMSDISQKELQYLIDKWKKALSEATKNAYGSMTINIDGKQFQTTEKEVANFTKRVLKSEKELRSRNPFKALKDSFNDLKKKQKEIRDLKDEINFWENEKSGASYRMKPEIESHISNLKKSLEDMSAQGATSMQVFGKALSVVGSEINSVAQDLSGMFDALGHEDAADTIGFIGEMAGSLANIGAGIASGNPVQVIQGIINGITSIANFHDKKLDRAIKSSQLQVQKLQNAYKALEYEIENTYGEERFKRTGELVSNLYNQQIELQKQLRAEQGKKKKDQSAIEDYKEQIAEIDRQIKDTLKSVRDEILGTADSAASSLASSLVDAFRNGENAAKAWGDTVDSIIDNMIANIIATKYILPEVEKAFEAFWTKATGATDEDRSNIAKQIAETENILTAINSAPSFAQAAIRKSIEEKLGMSIEEYIAKLKAQLEAMNNPNFTAADIESLKDGVLADLYNDPRIAPFLEFLSSNKSTSKNTLSKGIQSITEDTGDILASYINAMRADLAAQKQFVQQLVSFAQLHTDQFANMYAELLRIQVNTLATANNTAIIAETTTATYNLLRQATVKGSGTAINLA